MEKYIIVSGREPEDLQVTVNAKIEEGYVPIGGVTSHSRPGMVVFEKFYQAMILADKQ